MEVFARTEQNCQGTVRIVSGEAKIFTGTRQSIVGEAHFSPGITIFTSGKGKWTSLYSGSNLTDHDFSVGKAKNYIWAIGALYKLRRDGVLRRCVASAKRVALLEEAHKSATRGHMASEVTTKKVL